MVESRLHRAGVAGETLGLCDTDGGGAQIGEVAWAQAHHWHGAHEMVNAER